MAAIRPAGKQLAIAFLVLLAAQAMGADQKPKLSRTVPVQLWNGFADDAFTSSLFVAMVDAYKNSDLFVVSNEKKDQMLVVLLPGVDWRAEGDRAEISYAVEFSTIHGEKLGTAKGACWIDDYKKCADQILKVSRTIALKLT